MHTVALLYFFCTLSKRTCEYIQESLRRPGVEAHLHGPVPLAGGAAGANEGVIGVGVRRDAGHAHALEHLHGSLPLARLRNSAGEFIS